MPPSFVSQFLKGVMNKEQATHSPATGSPRSPGMNRHASILESLKRAYVEKNIAPGINLVVVPGMEISWEDFCALTPPNSIALDGLVGDAPKFDAQGVRANFNHHQNVNRLATRSTSGQVHTAIKCGLIDAFRKDGRPLINIYVNDPDQDSSLAVWLLAHHERLAGMRSEPLINKLLSAEDYIDTTAGGYPFDPRSDLMQELAWVFKPFVAARMDGRIRQMAGAEMANVIAAIGVNINRFTVGQSGREELDTRFDIIGGGEGWKMVKEVGFYARSAMFMQGIDAFVSHLGSDCDRHHYTIGKRSPFIPFPVEAIYGGLNKLEGDIAESGSSWNGSDTIGGSPRRVGSQFAPKKLEQHINQIVLVERSGIIAREGRLQH